MNLFLSHAPRTNDTGHYADLLHAVMHTKREIQPIFMNAHTEELKAEVVAQAGVTSLQLVSLSSRCLAQKQTRAANGGETCLFRCPARLEESTESVSLESRRDDFPTCGHSNKVSREEPCPVSAQTLSEKFPVWIYIISRSAKCVCGNAAACGVDLVKKRGR